MLLWNLVTDIRTLRFQPRMGEDFLAKIRRFASETKEQSDSNAKPASLASPCIRNRYVSPGLLKLNFCRATSVSAPLEAIIFCVPVGGIIVLVAIKTASKAKEERAGIVAKQKQQ